MKENIKILKKQVEDLNETIKENTIKIREQIEKNAKKKQL